MIYFNEFEPFAAEWLRNLYPKATVDERSIKDVQPGDVAGFRRVHLFGGIGGWELALQLAGWPEDRPVWTGSCPCQPYSAAGKQKGDADERNLWPEMSSLIRECRPVIVVGEQVPNAIGHGWLDGISADLEREGYAVGSIILGAHSVGAPHKRNRLYWCGVLSDTDTRPSPTRRDSGRSEIAQSNSPSIKQRSGQAAGELGGRRDAVPAGDSEHGGREGRTPQREWSNSIVPSGGNADGLGNANGFEFRGKPSTWKQSLDEQNIGEAWSDYRIVSCKDGKARRVGSGIRAVVNGIPRGMGKGQPELLRMVKGARTNRVGQLKGYGNAICPQVAAVFVRAVMDSLKEIEREKT